MYLAIAILMIMSAIALANKINNNLPKINIKEIMGTNMLFFGGLVLLSYALLKNFVELF